MKIYLMQEFKTWMYNIIMEKTELKILLKSSTKSYITFL